MIPQNNFSYSVQNLFGVLGESKTIVLKTSCFCWAVFDFIVCTQNKQAKTSTRTKKTVPPFGRAKFSRTSLKSRASTGSQFLKHL